MRAVINQLPIGWLKFFCFLSIVFGASFGLVLILAITLYFVGGAELIMDVLHKREQGNYEWVGLLALFLGMIPGAWLGWGGFVALIDEDKRHHFMRKTE